MNDWLSIFFGKRIAPQRDRFGQQHRVGLTHLVIYGLQ
jgi:hypothetical protein